MKHLPHVQSGSQTHNLLDLAKLIMDYEGHPDFAYGDLQKGVLIDMLGAIKLNPRQLLQIIPSRIVARALCLALRRGMYKGTREAELLSGVTYYCLTRAMAENPRDLSLYNERYEVLHNAGTFLDKPLQMASKGLHDKINSPVLLKVKARMLLTDLLYAEEYFKKGVILSTHRRALMDQLDNGQGEMPLYQHINLGLECHDKFSNYLEQVLRLDEYEGFQYS